MFWKKSATLFILFLTLSLVICQGGGGGGGGGGSSRSSSRRSRSSTYHTPFIAPKSGCSQNACPKLLK